MSKRPLDESTTELSSPSPIVSKRRRLSAAAAKTLAYANPSTQPLKPTPFQLPTPLTSFSYTPEHKLEFTNSSLRFFVDPPLGANLGYGYDRWKRKPDEKGRLDSLLKAWSKFRSEKGPLGEIGVVSWRGVMTKILTAPYEERDSWDLNVMSLDGTLYFEEHLSDEKLKDKNNMEPRHRLQSYYGYAFESYCTADHPSEPAPIQEVRQLGQPPPKFPSRDNEEPPLGWSGDVDTHVQWCSVVKTKLGNNRLVIGGEVDCVRGQYTGRTDNFVELKTSMTIRSSYDETKFEKKLMKFYFQSFLLGVPEVLVGFRTPSGILTTVQSFRTINMPRLVRGKPGFWDPLICLEWGDRFIEFLKALVSDESQEPPEDTEAASPSTSPADEDIPKAPPKLPSKPLVWRVRFEPRTGISVTLLDAEGVSDVQSGDDVDRVGFLPRWYCDEALTGKAS